MGYPTEIADKGRKLAAEGKSLEEVRAAIGKTVGRKTYDSWLDAAEKNRPKVDDLVSMINAQFDKLDAIEKQRKRLDAEDAEIRKFLGTFNITQRPQTAQTPA